MYLHIHMQPQSEESLTCPTVILPLNARQLGQVNLWCSPGISEKSLPLDPHTAMVRGETDLSYSDSTSKWQAGKPIV